MTSTHTDIPPHPTHDQCVEALGELIERFQRLSKRDRINATIISNYLADIAEKYIRLKVELARIAVAEPAQRASIQRALEWKPEGEE